MAIQDPNQQPAIGGQHFEPGQNQYEVREVSPGVGKLFLNGQACTIKIGGKIVTDPGQLRRIGDIAENTLGKLELKAGQKLQLTSTTATILKKNGRTEIRKIDIHDTKKQEFQTRMNEVFMEQTRLINTVAQNRGIVHPNPPQEQRPQRRERGELHDLEEPNQQQVEVNVPPQGPQPVPEHRPPVAQQQVAQAETQQRQPPPEDSGDNMGMPAIELPQYAQAAEQPLEFVIEMDETSEQPIATGSPPPRPERKQMPAPEVEHQTEEAVMEEVVVEELPEPSKPPAYAPPPPPQQKKSENLDVDTPPPPPAPDDVEIESGDEEAPPPPPPDEQFEIIPDYDLDAPPPPPPDAPPPPPNEPPPHIPPKAQTTGQSALLDQINAGNFGLKHVDKPEAKTPEKSFLQTTMETRRFAVAGDEVDGPDDDDNDDDVNSTSSQVQQAPVANKPPPPPPAPKIVLEESKVTAEPPTEAGEVPPPPPPPPPASTTPPVSPTLSRTATTGATTTLADEIAAKKLKTPAKEESPDVAKKEENVGGFNIGMIKTAQANAAEQNPPTEDDDEWGDKG